MKHFLVFVLSLPLAQDSPRKEWVFNWQQAKLKDSAHVFCLLQFLYWATRTRMQILN